MRKTEMTTDKLVIGLAGMPGSGKSIIVETAKENGYGIVTMGDVVREEAKKRELEPSPQNIGKLMLKLRQTEGKSVMAKKCVSKIEKMQEPRVLIDGIRSLDEVEEFEGKFSSFTLIAVHASPETRFRRLDKRQRSDDPDGWKTFHERDIRELSVGLGEAIAMAEHVIVNEETVDAAKKETEQVLKKVEQKWMK
jgi:dephospho-CoA kinase